MLYTFNNNMKHVLALKMVLFITLFSFVYVAYTVLTLQVASAQSMSKSRITMSPEHPNSGDTVKVGIEATGLKMDTALVTWRINGEIYQQNYAQSKISFVAGDVGTTYVISVDAQDVDGAQASKEISFTVSDISVLWEGVTYTHPFYKGRALPSHGSSVALQALPVITDSSGIPYPTDQLTYIWYLGGVGAPIHQGRGQNSVVMKNPRPSKIPPNILLSPPSTCLKKFPATRSTKARILSTAQ